LLTAAAFATAVSGRKHPLPANVFQLLAGMIEVNDAKALEQA